MRRQIFAPAQRRPQSGLTLIEFMISIVLGMIVVAALAMLIGNQSATRSEVDRAGRLIENGRYAIQTMTDDLQMAGYWGEIYKTPDSPTSITSLATLPDPCSVTINSPENSASPGLTEGTYLHVQGYDASTLTSSTLSCVSNWKSGTDIVVVRRADPDYSAILTSGVVDFTKLTAGQMYLQTGLTSATGTVFSYVLAKSAGSSSSDSTTFKLVTKSGAVAPLRKLVVHIYYVARCDVCTGSNADTIPTLKRVELGVASSAPSMSCSSCTVTIAEGIENMQIDYGVDSDTDGAPNGADVNAAATSLGSTGDNWRNAMSAKIYLLARSTDVSPSFTDAKSYSMGSASVSAANDAYQRHLFMQSVRFANPSLKRST